MARHLSWIDNDKLSNLFNRVGSSKGRAPMHARAPVAPPVAARPSAPPAPVVQAPPAPVVQAPPAAAVQAPPAAAVQAPPAAVVMQAPPAPVVQAPPVLQYAPEPEPEPFVPSADSELYSRMQEFLDWVMSATSLQGAVLADSDGLIIVQRKGSELEAAMTLGLGPMIQTVGDILFDNPTEKHDFHGHAVFEHHGRQLISLWAPTSQGTFYGVLIGDSIPAGNVLKLVERGLRAVFAD
jgi:hypothetical protein